MEVKEIVAKYATKEDKTVNVDLKSLSMDGNFRKEVLAVIGNVLAQAPKCCVILPSYKSGKNTLGGITNEIAASVLVKTLVTGNVENLKHLRAGMPKDIVLIKQSFRAGKELKEQISFIKSHGSNVRVICFIAHSRAKLEQFAKDNDVEMSAIVYADEL